MREIRNAFGSFKNGLSDGRGWICIASTVGDDAVLCYTYAQSYIDVHHIGELSDYHLAGILGYFSLISNILVIIGILYDH